MKSLLTILLFLSGTLAVIGQNVSPSDTLDKILPETPATIAALLPQRTVKSPTVAALGRYGEYPVSFYTGLPTIEIPIFSFQIGSLTVPIKLTYHAAGNRVGDRASWVGLGWSLQAGGLITRSVQGRPDEQSSGVLSTSVTDPNSFYNPTCPTATSYDRMRFLADNITDNQRDLFTYNTPDGSNSFILDGPTRQPFLLMAEPVTITSATGLTSFTLANADGIRFQFSDTELNTLASPPAYSYSGYTSAWLLNEIISLNTSERALFSYYPGLNQSANPDPITTKPYYTDLFETIAGESGIIPGPGTETQLDAAPVVSGRNLSEINFPMGKIQFVREATLRPDGGYALDYIDIFGIQSGSNTLVRIKRIDLNYANKARLGGATVTFLEGVQLLGGDLALIGSYSLSYNATPLPDAASFAKDYWGYYNGQTNSTLIPRQTLVAQERTSTSGSVTYIVGGANRTPNESLMTAWVLETIRYPTGGSTQFSFETNRYRDATNVVQLAGGLRIRQVRNYTTDNLLASTKTYRYGVSESGAGTFRATLPQTYNSVIINDFYQPFGTVNPKNYNYKTYVFSSSPVYPLSPDEGSPVSYPEVAEYTENGSGANTGRTVYTFRDNAADSFLSVGGGKGFLTSRRWDRGQLTSQTQYDNASRLLAQEVHTYQTLVGSLTSLSAGALVVRSLQQLNAIAGNNSPCLQRADQFIYQTYGYRQGLTKRTQTVSYDYGSDNTGRFTQKTTQTDYSPAFWLPVATRNFAEGSIVTGTRMSYPQSFTRPIANNASPELLGIRTLQQRNAYLPIETINYRIENLADDQTQVQRIKAGKLTTFTTGTVNGLATALPRQIYLAATDFNSQFTSPGSSTDAAQFSADRYNNQGGTTLFIDPIWQPRLNLTTYDTQGNLVSYSVVTGSVTTLTYNIFTPTNGIPYSLVTSQMQNVGQPSAQTTNYSYVLPLLGPASMTGPNGIVSSYEYDNFGRLKTVKDNQGSVLKQYLYRYGTQL